VVLTVISLPNPEKECYRYLFLKNNCGIFETFYASKIRRSSLYRHCDPENSGETRLSMKRQKGWAGNLLKPPLTFPLPAAGRQMGKGFGSWCSMLWKTLIDFLSMSKCDESTYVFFNGYTNSVIT
jgi:hypothetical protein